VIYGTPELSADTGYPEVSSGDSVSLPGVDPVHWDEGEPLGSLATGENADRGQLFERFSLWQLRLYLVVGGARGDGSPGAVVFRSCSRRPGHCSLRRLPSRPRRGTSHDRSVEIVRVTNALGHSLEIAGLPPDSLVPVTAPQIRSR